MLGGGQVLGAPLALRQRLVGDLPEQVLEEPVLAVLGRARVGLEPEHLLADEAAEQPLQLARSSSRSSAASAPRSERLPEHGGVAEQPPLLGRQPVQPRGDSACSVSGTSSESISPDDR